MDTSNDTEVIPEPLSAKFKESFAYKTIKDRLPVILTKVIDLLFRERLEIVQKYGEDSREELKAVIGRLSKLRNEMQTNKVFIALESTAEDAPLWNAYIAAHMVKDNVGTTISPKWFETSWLFSECYLYRRIREAFELSPSLMSLDPFHKQKMDSLYHSMGSIIPLLSDLKETIVAVNNDPSLLETSFYKYLEISLWGNRCDLSISGGEQVTPSAQLEHLQDNILVNNEKELWQVLGSSDDTKVDIILDNAGFELISDLSLAEFFSSSGLASKIRFHAKMLPWFVSDTMPKDFKAVLLALKESTEPVVKEFAYKCQNRLVSGEWILTSHHFWTLPQDFSQMITTCPDLYNSLAASDLLIFKGDLNYRKLVGDLRWDPTTPFRTALRGFLPSNICSLRTLKADVVVGLNPGHADRLSIVHPDWMTSGDYAVIQTCMKNNFP